MPKDKDIFASGVLGMQWHIFTKNVGLISCFFIIIALCWLISLSFLKKMSTMREAMHEFRSPISMRGDMISDLVAMDRFGQAVLKIEEQNRD